MKRLLTCTALAYLALFAGKAIDAQTVSVVYNFGSQASDPIFPTYPGILAQGRDGNLYSSAWGGAFKQGAAFKVTAEGTLTTLYSFTNGADGSLPYGGLTLGTDGNFYGGAYSGNLSGGAPYGTVFEMTKDGKLDTLYTFTDGSDGALPLAPPIQGVDGDFYGTTCGYECGQPPLNSYGSIYKITSSGTFTALHACGSDCNGPEAPLVQGTD